MVASKPMAVAFGSAIIAKAVAHTISLHRDDIPEKWRATGCNRAAVIAVLVLVELFPAEL